jgi:hypothetical protein
MYSYDLLELDCYYIVQLNEGDPLTLLQVKVKSDYCVYAVNYADTTTMLWVKKTDTIHDIIECLTDQMAQQWLNVYNGSEDAYYEEDDE